MPVGIVQRFAGVRTRRVAIVRIEPRFAAIELRAQLSHGFRTLRLGTGGLDHRGQPGGRLGIGIGQADSQRVAALREFGADA
jgi:L-alanine-DL-glutamate epimerase-like enolase superfamily enzyme